MAIQKIRLADRRVERTKKLLRDALLSLIREKDYDSIVVKEVLDRANVGRSAFYMHFRDKDELLASSIHDILGTVPSTHPPSSHSPSSHSPSSHMKSGGIDDRILWFSLPIFQHLDQHRRTGHLKLGARGRAVLHGHLHQVLADLIAEDISHGFQSRRKSASSIPTSLLVQYVASTFILVLNWWVESRSPLSSKEINELFRALILPTLAAISG